MYHVVLACSDLMTASRLELADGVSVVRVGSTADAAAALAAHPDAVLVVDLTAHAELPQQLRSMDVRPRAVLAFAPHVRTELLDAARSCADRVVARGAVMRDLRRQLELACNIRGDVHATEGP